MRISDWSSDVCSSDLAVVATIARIPPKSVSTDDKKVLETLDADLKRVVFGQDQAIEKLASAIKLSRAGLREPNKPIGNYLFSGQIGRASCRERVCQYV